MKSALTGLLVLSIITIVSNMHLWPLEGQGLSSNRYVTGDCYWISNIQKNWSDARRTCEDYGGHLAIINSDAEASWLEMFIKESQTKKKVFFIGVHSLFQEGVFLTIFGEELFQVEMKSALTGLLILSIITIVSNFILWPLEGQGISSERYVTGDCYWISSIRKNWSDARRTCEDYGGHLAIINSDAEASWLDRFILASQTVESVFFIGVHSLFQEGEFLTIFGEPLEKTGFAKWHPGQPDNYKGNEHCVAFSKGALSDIHCNGNYYYICEYRCHEK
ncbi:hypothetical protein C0J52_23786 [Blattella germanica]|nr:hypothetical protein C0J52_23786 [Blattella germanica]